MRVRSRTARIVRGMVLTLRNTPSDALYCEMVRVSSLWPRRDKFIARRVMSSEVRRRAAAIDRGMRQMMRDFNSTREPR